MSDMYVDPDDSNAAGMRVTTEGNCLRLSFLTFDGFPMSTAITVPTTCSEEAIRQYFRTLASNEDIYIALLRDHLAKTAPAPAPAKPAKPKKTLRNKLRNP